MSSNKQNIQKKLKSYSALAGTLVAAAGSADAQVVYTDVVPDSTVNNGGVYNLDLNNDDVADFQLLQRSGTYGGLASYDVVGVYALGANNAVDTSGGAGTATAMDIGVTIDGTLNWVDSTQMAAISPPTANALAVVVPMFGIAQGNFLGMNNKFLPLRFAYLGSTYYGWVRLDVAADAKSFVVKDYAYTDDADHYSVTGDMVGISEAALQNKVNIFSYNNNITVQLDPLVAAEGKIVITNLSGQAVSETAISSTETVVPFEQAKPGIYMVTVKQTHGSYTKRVFVK
ncbi:MAG: hypothetical protein JWO44_2156 [Bacteroidetes bacterium]|nr:hypothetical protein [Bacteroidota bacterium]